MEAAANLEVYAGMLRHYHGVPPDGEKDIDAMLLRVARAISGR